MLLAVVLVASARPVPTHAATIERNQSYTEVFQNPTQTLDGKAVQTDLYFSKEDYWQVHKATLSLNFQISQLASRQASDITLALNGVKFTSFRPSKATGLQTKQVQLPLRLLQGTNHLTIYGQVLNQDSGTLPQTPANWLTIYAGANVNFDYDLHQADPTVKSFYAHMTGMDTIANHHSAIVVPKQATDGELTAAMYALGGIARVITTTDTKLQLRAVGETALKTATYQLVVARYDHLPQALKAGVQLGSQAAKLATITQGKTHYLVVTARSDALLKQAARFVANQELMQETKTQSKPVSAQTQVFTSVLQYQGHYQLATQDTTVKGAGHHSATFFVSLPTDRTNADGSKVRLHLRYAKNLAFKGALATVTVDGKAIGSHKLSASKADDDRFTVTLPKSQALGNTFTISVDFDLAASGVGDSMQTPWAVIKADSEAAIRSRTHRQLLFSNFPSTFIKQSTYDYLLLVRPKTMTTSDLATLTDLGNLFGNYAQANTGQLRVTSKLPTKAAMHQASVVAFGTPKQNTLIAKLNHQLYFRFTKDHSGFLSNEKLSIERTYGQTIGTAQLLRSPANAQKALLVVTGATPEATLLGASQISTQADVSQYQGDAIVVDPDNQHYSYRFKKVAAVKTKRNVKAVITKNAKIIIYLVLAFVAVMLVVLAAFLIMRKQAKLGGDHHE